MGHQPHDESQRTTGIGPISTLALREPISTGGLSWDGNRTKYEYDGIGNIKAMRRSALDADTFLYDKASRLKEARFKISSAWKTESYTHDGWGNIATKTTNGDTLTYNPDAAGSNHIEAPYDASGNLLSWGEITYSYYPTNQLKRKLSPDWGSIYGYSASGERVGRYDDPTNGPDGTTYILRGPDNKPLRAYFEQNCSWVWKKDWIWRDGVALASIDASGTRFLHVDHLGTPRRITNASGALVSTHDHYPFGEEVQTASDGEVVKFTGHERDFGYASNTNDDLDYMHARYHHPTIARFLSVDPMAGIVGSSQSWNRYSYVANNPIAYIDPNGLVKLRAARGHELGRYAYGVEFETTLQAIGSVITSFMGRTATAIGVPLSLDDSMNWYTNDTSEIRGLDSVWSKAKFESALAEAFEALGARPYAGDLYSSESVNLLEQAVDQVVRDWIANGKISGEIADEIRRAYDPATLKGQARAKQGYRTPDENDPAVDGGLGRTGGPLAGQASQDDPFAGTGFCSADGVCH